VRGKSATRQGGKFDICPQRGRANARVLRRVR